MIALLVITFFLGVFVGVFIMGLASMARQADPREPLCDNCIFADNSADKREETR